MEKKHKIRFTTEEDELLIQLVNQYGILNWKLISNHLPYRNERQCFERWTYYLSPYINHSPWNQIEDELLMNKVQEIGKKWVIISTYFNRRTPNSIKNRFKQLEKTLLIENKSLKLLSINEILNEVEININSNNSIAQIKKYK